MEEKRTKDYANGKIYAIYNYIDPSLIYVGSTCQSLSKRLAKHRSEINCRNTENMLLYKKMREFGREHFYIELLEEYPCNNNEQLRAREGHYIRDKGTLNARIEDRTNKEWRYDNNDYLKEQKKNYYQEHKEVIKTRMSDYNQRNTEEVRQRCKAYYHNNKDKVKTKFSEVIHCDCGSTHTRQHKARHLKSQKHQAYLKQQEEN